MSRTKRNLNPWWKTLPKRNLHPEYVKKKEIAGDASCKHNEVAFNYKGPHKCDWSRVYHRNNKRYAKRRTHKQQRRYYAALTQEEIMMNHYDEIDELEYLTRMDKEAEEMEFMILMMESDAENRRIEEEELQREWEENQRDWDMEYDSYYGYDDYGY